MNFFEQQHIAKKQTKLFVLYLFLAVILIILAIDALVFGVVIFSTDYNIYEKISPTRPGVIPISREVSEERMISLMTDIALYVSPIVICVIVLGTLVRMYTLRSGGVGVAEMVDARLIPLDSKITYERKLLNVVEEMSIASGIPIPKIYIMDHEQGINAFVAGIYPNDTVMVVTKGALVKLNRDELQGVVAHEFGHIFNSDMQMSVKLIGLLAGILLIGQLGYFILRSLRFKSSSSSKKGSGVLMVFLLGLGLWIVGYIGLFFGRLIKAAISRQRELLADANSVQFTRNPVGLVGALQKIAEGTDSTFLHTRHAEDISHICFAPSLAVFFTNLLDTHPPIEFRIHNIDPQGLYRPEPERETSTDETEATSKNTIKTQNIMPILGTIGLQIAAQDIQNSIGNPTQAHIDFAVALLKNIPSPLLEVARDPKKVQELYYALFITRSFTLLTQKESELKAILDGVDFQSIKNICDMIKQLDPRAILPLIDLSLPAFKFNLPPKRKQIFDNLNKITSLDSNKDIFEFAILAIISKALTDLAPSDLTPKYSSFNEVLPEITLLLSFVVAAYREDDMLQDQRFQKAAKMLTDSELTRINIQSIDIQKLIPALSKLNLLTPLCTEKLIQVCIQLVQEDQKITLSEAELIRGIAATLDCPIPPIISTV